MNHAAEPAFLPVFAMWSVMMLAMMLPSASPVILLFARARSARGGRRGIVPVPAFIAGYALVWIAFSTAAALLQMMLGRAMMLTPGMSIASRPLSGAVLMAAGVFQFTPIKRACLSQCRSPLGSIMSYWRDGTTGALRMGARQGIFCLGCCWAEMLTLFVVGVMNLRWIVLLAAFVIVEKAEPAGALVSRIGGAIMIAAGSYLVLTALFR